jgi:predicted nuclease with TOPRIM domain
MVEASGGLVGLEEALGLPELGAVVRHLQKVVSQLHQAGRTRNIVEMESTIYRLELENSKLQEAMAKLEGDGDDRLARMRDELQQQQIALVELKRLEASSGLVSRQIGALETIIKQEREEKEQAVNMCNKLRTENDALTKELSSMIRDSMNNRALVSQVPYLDAGFTLYLLFIDAFVFQVNQTAEIEILREQLNALQDELFAAHKELSAVAHHRQTLRDAVEQLERLLKSKVDALADSEFAFDRNVGNSRFRLTQGGNRSQSYEETAANGGDDQQYRQLVRARAKSNCLEEITAIYRSGIQALYPDGTSYGAAQHHVPNVITHQHGGSARAHAPHSLSSIIQNGWFQKEISVVKKSCDDEIRLLEAEIGELRGKLKQSNSYVSELRKRFEDNMKILYRYC